MESKVTFFLEITVFGCTLYRCRFVFMGNITFLNHNRKGTALYLVIEPANYQGGDHISSVEVIDLSKLNLCTAKSNSGSSVWQDVGGIPLYKSNKNAHQNGELLADSIMIAC